MIHRFLETEIKKMASEFPVVVLTGARQVGKTTLLQSIFSDHKYISLDIPSVADLAQNNPDLFLEMNPPPLIVDEVQYAPQLFRHLKVWIDKNRKSKGRIILTGSQKFNLMKEVSDSLAGRVGYCDLEGLSFFEYQKYTRANKLAEIKDIDWMARGQYPELWAEPNRQSQRYYQSYFNTYIERDVRQIINVTSLLDFEKFMRLLAARNGQILVKSELAKDVGVKSETISNWLSVVETSNIISFLKPYYKSISKTMVKSPKVYFNDTGLLLYLLGMDKPGLIDSPLIGFVWESLFYAELRKKIQASGSLSQIYFYLDYKNYEIDFLIEKNQKLGLVECKWSQNPKMNPLMASFLENNKLKIFEAAFFSRNPAPLQIAPEVMGYSLEHFPFEKFL